MNVEWRAAQLNERCVDDASSYIMGQHVDEAIDFVDFVQKRLKRLNDDDGTDHSYLDEIRDYFLVAKKIAR